MNSHLMPFSIQIFTIDIVNFVPLDSLSSLCPDLDGLVHKTLKIMKNTQNTAEIDPTSKVTFCPEKTIIQKEFQLI